MADHGIVRDIRVILAAGGEWSPRQVTALVRRPRWWTHQKLYSNVSSLLSQYAKKGAWMKIRPGWYCENATKRDSAEK